MKRFSVYLTRLDPTVGAEMQKTRPAVIVSTASMNASLRTVIIAPLSTAMKRWPSRIPVRFDNRDGEIALDQLRSVDRSRLIRRLGSIDRATADLVADRLVEMFERGP